MTTTAYHDSPAPSTVQRPATNSAPSSRPFLNPDIEPTAIRPMAIPAYEDCGPRVPAYRADAGFHVDMLDDEPRHCLPLTLPEGAGVRVSRFFADLATGGEPAPLEIPDGVPVIGKCPDCGGPAVHVPEHFGGSGWVSVAVCWEQRQRVGDVTHGPAINEWEVL